MNPTDKNPTMKKVIQLAASGKRIPAVQLVREDPGMAAVVSKLMRAREPAGFTQAGQQRITDPDVGSFRALADKMSENISDSETIQQLLPEINLWKQILVSSILSPKDMVTSELTYVPPEDLLPSEVSGALINRIGQYFEQTYKIKPELVEILNRCLFDTGSYPVAVIPENSLDEIINSNHKLTMESLTAALGADGEIEPKGILGPVVKSATETTRKKTGIAFESLSVIRQKTTTVNSTVVAFEGMEFNTNLTVTDNPDVLKVPRINARLREQEVMNAYGVRSMENMIKLNDREISSLIYKNRQPGYQQLASLKTNNQLKRRSVGEPLILTFASEAVLPVHVPGSPDKHIGAFVLIDGEGNPLSRGMADDHYHVLGQRMGGQSNMPSALINRVGQMMGVQDFKNFDPRNRAHVDYSVRAYSELVEADLLARLRNGIYGNGVAVANNQEIYRIMFARALQSQQTQLLFIPMELMTYFAFKFQHNGIGKSLIDEMKILLSMRIILRFSDVMASTRNSIGRTKVRIKLDPNDPDPRKAIEMAIGEITRTRQQNFPIGINNPNDIVDYLQRAGFEFAFEGHPDLPEMEFNFEETQTNIAKPDTELSDALKKDSIMATGLNPESVDAGFNAEFAKSIVNNNILLSKRVVQIQEVFLPYVGDFCRKIMLASQPLTDDLMVILKENLATIKERLTDEFKTQSDEIIISRVFYDFINGFSVSLPQPNSVTLENQADALDIYIKSLDIALDNAYISSEFFTEETGGEIAGSVDVIKKVIRASYIRKWMQENGMMPELSALTATGENGKPMIDFYEDLTSHVTALGKSLTQFMVKVQKPKEEVTETLEANGVTAPEAPAPESEDTGGGGGGDDDFGLGDLDLDGVGGGTEEPAAGTEETPAPEAGTEEKPEEEPKKEEPPAE